MSTASRFFTYLSIRNPIIYAYLKFLKFFSLKIKHARSTSYLSYQDNETKLLEIKHYSMYSSNIGLFGLKKQVKRS